MDAYKIIQEIYKEIQEASIHKIEDKNPIKVNTFLNDILLINNFKMNQEEYSDILASKEGYHQPQPFKSAFMTEQATMIDDHIKRLQSKEDQLEQSKSENVFVQIDHIRH